MAVNKNQHFVPRFLLKGFSVDDGANIGVFVIENSQYINKGPIKSQASEVYFYGKDDKLDSILRPIESNAAIIIGDILKTHSLPTHGSEKHSNLVVFVMSMLGRTPSAADKAMEIVSKIFSKVIEDGLMGDDAIKALKEDELKIKCDMPVLESLRFSLPWAILLSDLKVVLLKSELDIKFIISDNPVVFYNQFLEKRMPERGSLGFVSPGLQIFLPISANECLMFSDALCYDFIGVENDCIQITKLDDIKQINQLQYLAADKCLFFNDEVLQTYLENLCRTSKKLRRTEKTKVQKIIDLYHGFFDVLSDNAPKIKLNLSFVNEKSNAEDRAKLLCRDTNLLQYAEKLNRKSISLRK